MLSLIVITFLDSDLHVHGWCQNFLSTTCMRRSFLVLFLPSTHFLIPFTCKTVWLSTYMLHAHACNFLIQFTCKTVWLVTMQRTHLSFFFFVCFFCFFLLYLFPSYHFLLFICNAHIFFIHLFATLNYYYTIHLKVSDK